MTHTPGPWSVHNKPGFSRLFIASDTYDVAEMCHAGDEEREAANARLIAAAPELLRACKLFLREYTRNDGAVLCYCCDPHFEPSPGETKCDICVFVAAIAKAEGRGE